MLCSQTPLLNIICNRDFLLRSAMISEHACYPLNQSDATSEWKGIWPGLSFSVLERPEYLRDWCACLILLIFTLLVLICRYDFLGSVLSPSNVTFWQAPRFLLQPTLALVHVSWKKIKVSHFYKQNTQVSPLWLSFLFLLHVHLKCQIVWQFLRHVGILCERGLKRKQLVTSAWREGSW